MWGSRCSAVILGLLLLPLNAQAWGWRAHYARTTAYYYYPAPIVWSPPITVVSPAYAPAYVPAPPPCPPYQGPPPRLYAPPSPAPPSGGTGGGRTNAEPPINPIPAVTESRSYFDAYKVAPGASDKPLGDRCFVGFWNLSDRALTLRIDGQARVLEPGKNLKLQLARRFVWQVADREPLSENIPTAESAMEIVIRR